MSRSSISDYLSFRAAVKEAATSPGKFDNFLKHPAILEIFGHYKYDNALKIWFKHRNKFMKSKYFVMSQEFEYGKGTLLPKYDRFDEFSVEGCIQSEECKQLIEIGIKKMKFQSFIMEFVRVVYDIQDKLGIDNFRDYQIVELGVGFLGQFMAFAGEFECYFMIDLPEVLMLADKIQYEKETVTDQLNVANVEHVSTFEIDNRTFSQEGLAYNGIFLSSHAFSELTREHQELIYDTTISHCRAGYLLMNRISHLHGVDSMNLDEHILRLKGLGKENIQVHEEWPLTFKGNYVLTWGTPIEPIIEEDIKL